MGFQPGDPVYSGEIAETRSSDATVNAGDAVAITATGEITAATNADTFAGVARYDDADPGENVLVLTGVVLANVNTTDADGAVVEGSTVTPSPNAGEFYRDYTVDGTTGAITYTGAGPALALSDEGGVWSGHGGTLNVPAGYAVVKIHHGE